MNLNQKTVRLSRLALFSALILLLNYTPLGYIRVFALEITLIIIPVTLGAMLWARQTAPSSAASLA